MSRCRLYGLLSLGLLGGYAASVLMDGHGAGLAFSAVTPWPLGGGPGTGGLVLRFVSLALGLALGWGIPGLALALLTDESLRGSALLGRAFGLGCGYILLVGLGHAALASHAPGRATLLVLLAIPPAVSVLRGGARDRAGDAALTTSVALMVLLTAVLWGKLHREGMNGDGTEAYELARSLDGHPAPYWDLERWEGPGKFGTPAVNPFLTNSYLVNATMALLGRGELAARLPLVPAVVLCGILAVGRLARPSSSGFAYAVAVTAVFLLWNSYYVGYEPPFTDLAEPAFTDTFMAALFLAGFAEVASGSTPLGVGFLVLAAGVLYSAPILATTALAALAPGSGRRALRLWLAAGVIVVPLALAYGIATGDVADWFRQAHSEYWYDLVSKGRRTPSLPIFGQFLLLTGGLPLVAAFGIRRLSAPSRALLATGVVYLAIVLASSYKNLHYVAPLPFVLMAPALEASGPRARAVATAFVLAAFALSWPGDRSAHRETVALGQSSCVDGLGYEQAALGADAIYGALDRPGRIGRLAVGKHTFVRYALELGGSACAIRLARGPREGWIAVAGDDMVVSVRDVDAYVRWRFRVPSVPSSWLFPRPAPTALSADARRWMGRTALADEPGSALVLDGLGRETSDAGGLVRPLLRMRGLHARLLVPAPRGSTVILETVASESGALVGLRVNDAEVRDLTLRGGFERTPLPLAGPSWREGWNVVELVARAAVEPELRLQALEVRAGEGSTR